MPERKRTVSSGFSGEPKHSHRTERDSARRNQRRARNSAEGIREEGGQNDLRRISLENSARQMMLTFANPGKGIFMKLGLIVRFARLSATALWCAAALVRAVQAEEKLGALQTALSSTTISG